MTWSEVWSSQQKAAATKNAMKAIFAMCRSDIIKKTDSIEISPGFCTSMTQE